MLFHWGSVLHLLFGVYVCMRLGVGDNMYMYLTDKAWQKQRAEKLLQKEEQEGENGKKKVCFFSCACVSYTINPVRWWRLAVWWVNIPLLALYGTYNGPDVTMETKHPSQKECCLNFQGKLRDRCWIGLLWNRNIETKQYQRSNARVLHCLCAVWVT